MACVSEVREFRTEPQTEILLEPGVQLHIESHAGLHAELRSAKLTAPTHDPSASVQVHLSSILPTEPGPSNGSQELHPRPPSSIDTITLNTSSEPHSVLEDRDSRPSLETSLQPPQPLGRTGTNTSTSVSPIQAPQSKSSSWRKFWTVTTPDSSRRNPFSKISTSFTNTHSSHRHPTVKPVVAQPPSAPSSVVSSSTPASSLVFSLQSLTSTRTSVDADTIFLPASSSKMYLFCEKTQLYIGKLRELPLPVDMESEWRDTIYSRLLRDLRCILQSLPNKRSRAKTIVEPELRLVGELDAHTGLVELRPTVVIRCGCESYRAAIHDGVKDLRYIHAFSKGVVLVHRKAPKQASRPLDIVSSSLASLQAQHIDGLVELALPDTASACGMSMRYTSCVDMSVRQSLGTIGGLIKINNTVYGLTTGHTVTMLPDEDVTDTDSDSESDTGSESETSSSTSSASLSEKISGAYATLRDRSAHRIYAASEPIQWVSASLGPFSYLQNRSCMESNDASPLSEANDFALVELGEGISNLTNSYTSSCVLGQDTTTTTWTIDTISTEETTGPVSIICSPTDVRPAHLLEGEYGYLDQCAFFSTRKVQTARPLEQGLSGAWVVRGSHLIGMILAVYEDEPYAHVLPISAVFRAIETFLSKEQLLCKASLPTRPHPLTKRPSSKDYMDDTNPNVALDSRPTYDAPISTTSSAQRRYTPVPSSYSTSGAMDTGSVHEPAPVSPKPSPIPWRWPRTSDPNYTYLSDLSIEKKDEQSTTRTVARGLAALVVVLLFFPRRLKRLLVWLAQFIIYDWC